MPNVTLVTKDTVYEGSSARLAKEFINSPFNFLTGDATSLYQTSLPFSMNLITMDLESDFPYKMTIFSPGYYLHTELERDEYKNNVLNRGQHMHNTYEIVYTRHGEFYQQIEANRYRYTEGTCCILNRNVRHKEEYTSNFSIVTLSLSPEFLLDILNDSFSIWFNEAGLDWLGNNELQNFFSSELSGAESERKSYLNFIPNEHFKGSNDNIRILFDQLTMHISSPLPGSSHSFKAIICQILASLGNESNYSTSLFHIGSDAENRIFAKITALMEARKGRITRSELMELTNYSGSYLNKIVKKYSGRNLSQYGNYFSMLEATRLLRNTDLSIDAIAEQIGFTDRTHFYSLFKQEYGVTPAVFRRNSLNDSL